MSEQRTAPRWEDVPEAARGAARQAMSLIRDDARYVDTLRLALDAALARLAEPTTAVEPEEKRASLVSLFDAIEMCAGDIDDRHASKRRLLADLVRARWAFGVDGAARPKPTAAERWRAVPEALRREIVEWLPSEIEYQRGEIEHIHWRHDGLPDAPGGCSCLADIAAREKRVAMLDALLALARGAEGGR